MNEIVTGLIFFFGQKKKCLTNKSVIDATLVALPITNNSVKVNWIYLLDPEIKEISK